MAEYKVPIVSLHLRNEGVIKYNSKNLKNQKTRTKLYAALLTHLLIHTDREHEILITLDETDTPTGISIIAIGTSRSVGFSLREVMKTAVCMNAYGVVMAHNHPNGLVLPSNADLKSSRELGRILEEMDIRLVDSIVFSPQRYYSMVEHKRIPNRSYEKYEN